MKLEDLKYLLSCGWCGSVIDTRYAKESESDNPYTCKVYECSRCDMDILEEE